MIIAEDDERWVLLMRFGVEGGHYFSIILSLGFR
jgi:hypothetical protein